MLILGVTPQISIIFTDTSQYCAPVDSAGDGRAEDGGEAAEHDEQPEGGGELLEAEHVHEEDGGEGDEGGDGEPVHQAQPHQLAQAVQQGEQEDAAACE